MTPDPYHDLLLSEEQLQDYQVIDFIGRQLSDYMGHLLPAQQQRYLALAEAYREAGTSLLASLQARIESFESPLEAELKSALKRKTGQAIDPHSHYLNLTITGVAPGERKHTTHTRSATLWDLARAGHGYTRDYQPPTPSERDLKAVFISDSRSPLAPRPAILDAEDFFAIVRELDAKARWGAYLARQPSLYGKVQKAEQLLLQLALLDTRRLRDDLPDEVATQLRGRLQNQDIQWSRHDLRLSHGPLASLFDSPLTLPLFTFSLGHHGTHYCFSYYPERPNGGLQVHASEAQALSAFLRQLRDSARKGEVAWFAQRLSISDRIKLFAHLNSKPLDTRELNPVGYALYTLLGDDSSAVEKAPSRARRLVAPVTARQPAPSRRRRGNSTPGAGSGHTPH